jgi:hypothetical protein
MAKPEVRMVSTRDALVAVLVVLTIATGFNVWDNLENGGRISGVLARVKNDEHKTKVKAEHTAEVQVAGGPVAKCLLNVMIAVKPLLATVPKVEKPLNEYAQLQAPRYPGVVCPDGIPEPKPKQRP